MLEAPTFHSKRWSPLQIVDHDLPTPRGTSLNYLHAAPPCLFRCQPPWCFSISLESTTLTALVTGPETNITIITDICCVQVRNNTRVGQTTSSPQCSVLRSCSQCPSDAPCCSSSAPSSLWWSGGGCEMTACPWRWRMHNSPKCLCWSKAPPMSSHRSIRRWQRTIHTMVLESGHLWGRRKRCRACHRTQNHNVRRNRLLHRHRPRAKAKGESLKREKS